MKVITITLLTAATMFTSVQGADVCTELGIAAKNVMDLRNGGVQKSEVLVFAETDIQKSIVNGAYNLEKNAITSTDYGDTVYVACVKNR